MNANLNFELRWNHDQLFADVPHRFRKQLFLAVIGASLFGFVNVDNLDGAREMSRKRVIFFLWLAAFAGRDQVGVFGRVCKSVGGVGRFGGVASRFAAGPDRRCNARSWPRNVLSRASGSLSVADRIRFELPNDVFALSQRFGLIGESFSHVGGTGTHEDLRVS